MTILYITQNGITTHIGRSQVASYLLGLARAGFNIALLSAEPEGQELLIAQYKMLFDEVGIRWTRVLYRNKPAIVAPLLTQLRLSRAARNIVSAGGVEVVHCRSHPTALIGYRLKQRYGIKFIFDFRDFYADWGLQNTRGIKRMLYQRIKRLEGPMVRTADRIICLTHRACNVLNDAYLGGGTEPLARFQVVPCCADFAHFDLSKVSAESIKSVRERLGLPEDAFVLLYLGSLGTDYLLGNMITLFRQLLKLQPKAYFLFVSNNGEALVHKECEHQSVPIDRIRFTSALREAVPAHIALADLSVVFIRADHTKVGCSPTKLAELFACNVPVIANPGVGDLDAIIDPSKNGSVIVSDFSDEALLSALEKAIGCTKVNSTPVNIRENSRVFSLEEGVARYQQVYLALLKSSW
jgi:glycosyltransferase involved in cell wall biosynthesis